MEKKNRNRKSPRHQNWDYGWDAAYFITICTKNRQHYFGKIIDKKMVLSPIGVLANVFFHDIPQHAKNVSLGEFVVMPNHVHGILILEGNKTPPVAGTGHALSLPALSLREQRFRNQGKNTVSSMIGGYKSAVTKHARRLGYKFEWQVRFHDHIIRDEKSFDNISRYIMNNSKKWDEDRFNQ